MSINDDILLLKLIQSGNEQAFKYLFDTYFASLCRFAHVYVYQIPKMLKSLY